MAIRGWIVGGVFLACTGALAEAVPQLDWTFPQALGPQDWHLTIIQTTAEQTTLQTVPLAVLDVASCRQQLGNAYIEGESWCARLPCPPSGAYQFVLQANEASPPSDPAALGIQAPPCTEVPFDEAIARALPTKLPPPVPLPPPVQSPPAPAPAAPPTPHVPETQPAPPSIPHLPPATPAEDPTPVTREEPPPPATGGDVAPKTAPVVEPAPGPTTPDRSRRERRRTRRNRSPQPPPPAAPPLFDTVAVPDRADTDALTGERFVEAFADLARRYGEAMDRLVADYNEIYDDVLAHPSPAGQRRLERLYQRTTRRQQAIYDQATQAWERLYVAWQQFVLAPPQPTRR